MTTAAPVTMTVAEAARAIADEIRQCGHYQNKPGGIGTAMPAPACIVLNCTWPALDKTVALQLLDEIRDRAKMTVAYPENSSHSLRAKTVIWNDNESTERVLEVLDAIAISGA